MSHDVITDLILGGLGPVYGQPFVPLMLAIGMVVMAAMVIAQGWSRTRPFERAADTRIAAIKEALGSSGEIIQERASFYEHFPEVARAMAAGSGDEPLVQAWREFHEQIIDETVSPIRNTSRPDPFFRRVGPKQTALVFWSNVAVGAGLVLTFLGLIYALAVAAKGMQAGGSDVAQAQAQASLIALLTAAAAKFTTSVGGLVASLMLRFGEHNLTKGVVSRVDRICVLLERGLLYVPAQKLAVEQLDELRIHSKELKSFNTDLALQISERMGAQFSAAIAPVADSLAALNVGMASMGEGLREGLAGGAAEAVSAAASGELRALGQTLNALGQQLEGMGGADRSLRRGRRATNPHGGNRLQGSGREYPRRLRQAGAPGGRARRSDDRARRGRREGAIRSVGSHR